MRTKMTGIGVALGITLFSGMSIANTVYYVASDTGDDDNGGTGWNDAVATLHAAIGKASSESEIWVKAGIYQPTEDSNRTKSFVMKNGVDLYGGFAGTETELAQRDWTNNPTILCGDIGEPGDYTDNSYHVVVGATARIDGFTIRNGFASGTGANIWGAGMYSAGVSPVTANCVFTSNRTGVANNGGGAGLYWAQAANTTAAVGWYNCAFIANESYRPANYSYGSAMYLSFSTNIVGTISNCLFQSNVNTGSYGRATVYLADAGKEWPAGSGLRLEQCRFLNNSNNYDGALYLGGFQCPVFISDCLFAGNQNLKNAGAVTLSLAANSAGVQVTDSVFNGNFGSHGGAVSGGAGTNSWWRDCVFVNNRGTHSGGALHNLNGRFTACAFSNNIAYNYGGAVYASAATVNPEFDSCVFMCNTNEVSYGGGAVYAESPLVVRDSFFIRNRGTGSGGAVYRKAAARITGCVFEYNSSSVGGGALYNSYSDGGVSNCVFIGNSAPKAGGAWSEYAANAMISDCTFVSNRCNGGFQWDGGAIYMRAGTSTLQRCVFTGNEASYAGAVYYYYGKQSRVQNCLFADNNAASCSAVYLQYSDVDFENVTFAGNTATALGALCQATANYTSHVVNAIFWANMPQQISGSGTVACRYTDVQNGYAGSNMFEVDPLFADSEYWHLQSTTGYYDGGYFSGGTWRKAGSHSTLIDAGDPSADGSREPTPWGERINLGAYGGTETASKSWIPAGTLFLVR